MYCFHKIFLL